MFAGQQHLLDHAADVLYYAVVVVSNMLGVVCLELLKWFLSVHASTRNPASILALPILALLVACDALDAIVGSSKWHMCLPAAAFGAQNALVSSPQVLGLPTTIMTGNIAKVGTAMVELCKARGSRQAALDVCKMYLSNLCAVVFTVLGAVAAALAIRARDEVSNPTSWAFVPTALVLAVLLCALGHPAD